MAYRAPLLAASQARRRGRLQRDRRVQHRLDGAQRLRLVDDQLYSNGGDVPSHRHRLRTQPDVHNDPLHHYKRRRRHKDSVLYRRNGSNSYILLFKNQSSKLDKSYKKSIYKDKNIQKIAMFERLQYMY